MVGRQEEVKVLRKAFDSAKSEFVAVYGRRRVGKTFLVNETFRAKYAFHHAGLENAAKGEQLASFCEALRQQGHRACPRLPTWIRAFAELEAHLERLPEGKKVVFLDELPWYDTPKSGFLAAFESFWNGWASLRNDILLVVCGSATTWIVDKIIRNRGGLHNRVTRQIPVLPFNLRECEEYAAYLHLDFDRLQIAECFMAFGGVAYYWSLLDEGLSAAQNFDRLFFGAADEMRGEYKRLFSSLFRRPTRHFAIVEMLGKRKVGMTREEIVAGLPEGSGGEVTNCLEELCDCGFLRRYNVIGNAKKGAIYQLIDNYVLFYFQFLRNRKGSDPRFWTLSYEKPALNAWRGLAFERLCLWHLDQIRTALGISGVLTDAYAWRAKDGSEGGHPYQVDLVLDRGDRTIDLCEIKFSASPYGLSGEEMARMEARRAAFVQQTGTRKGVRHVMVTANGLARNKYSGNIAGQVTLQDLFR